MSIQVEDIFDDSMIKVIEKQDKMIALINMIYNPVTAAPIDYNTVINSAEGNDWRTSIEEELTSMNEQQYNEYQMGVHQKLKPLHFNARLVARGFQQIQGMNFEETFAPTPTFTSLWLLFLISINKGWGVRTFDVKLVFLNSPIDKPVYVWPPRGMKLPSHAVLRLNKALYGTKQAARCWWLQLQHILKNIGFCVNQEDTRAYYMDSKLDKALRVKWDERVNNSVGISITLLADGFKFHQPDLILKLLNIDASNITSCLLLPIKCDLESGKGGSMDKEYLRRIGLLLYIAQGSWPDISYAVNYLARFCMGPTVEHWDALRNLIVYLRFTHDKCKVWI
ncbi:hypothetical protein O181_101097 [Austropuccinia psidii MF-1]|uniref:Reverse transcriptase Ty1/copia-type domain-containing protein n=1 Tax=Austropuccinia psidii MF-1 TaxID=1389203 RepID=A0A9Q3PI64_9BASI|nr:hypothetical protein [Austropuccinia psidii MF-1]